MGWDRTEGKRGGSNLHHHLLKRDLLRLRRSIVNDKPGAESEERSVGKEDDSLREAVCDTETVCKLHLRAVGKQRHTDRYYNR